MLSPKLYREQTHLETDMPSTQAATDHRFAEYTSAHPTASGDPDPLRRKPPAEGPAKVKLCRP